MYYDFDTAYVTGWIYFDDFEGTAQYSNNQKVWPKATRTTASQDPYGSNLSSVLRIENHWGGEDGWPDDGNDQLQAFNMNSDSINFPIGECEIDGEDYGIYCDTPSTTPELHSGKWMRFERYWNLSEGITWFTLLNGGVAEYCTLEWDPSECPSGINDYTPIINGIRYGNFFRTTRNGYISGVPEPYPGTLAQMHMYTSEYYVDFTQARVEVGDESIFANCLHREIQTPLYWSDTEIEFNFHSGSFAPGTEVHFFFVDENGVATLIDSRTIIIE